MTVRKLQWCVEAVRVVLERSLQVGEQELQAFLSGGFYLVLELGGEVIYEERGMGGRVREKWRSCEVAGKRAGTLEDMGGSGERVGKESRPAGGGSRGLDVDRLEGRGGLRAQRAAGKHWLWPEPRQFGLVHLCDPRGPLPEGALGQGCRILEVS